MEIGFKLSKMRKEKNMSQPELSHILGISQTALCEIESGKTKKIDFQLMMRVCEYFDVEVEYFTGKPRKESFGKPYLNDSETLSTAEKLIGQYQNTIDELKNLVDVIKQRNC